MEQFSFFEPPVWSVTNVTRYLRDLLESDQNLQDVWVRGEISNFSRPSSGHLYFTIKDTSATLRCVMWRNMAARLRYSPRDGDEVEVHGGISVYEAGGQYQLYADMIRPLGEGALFQEFLRLKESLEAEGLFDLERKRPLPPWPAVIGIVSSPTGAALRDMLNTLRRRYPLVRIVLAPTPVQGEDAPPKIVAALSDLERYASPDVILVARGGGSMEDLWAFNDERVARAIAVCSVPVVTGVGHETDFTIADFVSDLRAPTPTAAAELVTPNQSDLALAQVESLQRLSRSVALLVEDKRRAHNDVERRLALRSPLGRIQTDRQRLDEYFRRIERLTSHELALRAAHLDGLDRRLKVLNPMATLQRGFAVVSLPDGTPVSNVHQVRQGDDLNVRVLDGEFNVRVTSDPVDEEPQ
jgi:exodeoxyribonuclease VII large subunit